jgi:ABC-type glycerol-3-phosphate transport system permease component
MARIDAPEFTIYWRIILPLARPAPRRKPS